MSETKFKNLPLKVVADILFYFDLTERQKLRGVSKSWNQNIVSLYGVNLTVHNLNLESCLDCGSESDSIKAYFQSLTCQFPINTDSGIHFLNRLTSLTLSGSIVCYNIVPLFEHCLHLRKLEFIRCFVNHKMAEYQVNIEDRSKLLPKLDDLTIKFRDRPYLAAEYNFFKSLLPFFTINPDLNATGKLHSIFIDCPVKGGPFRTSFDKIFQTNTFRHVQGFGAETPDEHRCESADEFYTALLEANLKSLRVLELKDENYGCGIKMKFCENCPGIKIEEFEQTAYPDTYMYDQAASSITLFNLLTHQNCLTKLSVGLSNNLTLDQMCSIADGNTRTLESLSIGLFTPGFEDDGIRIEQIDASKFSKLTVLKYLKIYPFIPYEPNGGLIFSHETNTRMHNINNLPVSLRVLSTSAALGFDHENEFNQSVFGHLIHLQTFELTGTPYFQFGMTNVYNIDAQKINELISWLPSLKKLILRNSRPYANIENLDLEDFQIPVVPWIISDTLPDSSTNWIHTTSSLSYQKVPIVFLTRRRNEIPALIGRYEEYDDVYIREVSGIRTGFPTIFEGVVSVKPNYRENSAVQQVS